MPEPEPVRQAAPEPVNLDFTAAGASQEPEKVDSQLFSAFSVGEVK